MANKVEAAIFDVDGCLLDTEEFIFQAYEHTLQLNDYPVPDRVTMASYIGRSLRDCYDAFVPGSYTEAMSDAHREFQEQNFELIKVHDEALETLERLSAAGIKLGAWSSRKLTLIPSLEHSGIARYFDSIVHGGQVTEHKPHPEGLFKSLSQLSVSPERAAMIGDADVDIEAGVAAGVAITIGITHGFGALEELQIADPDYIIDSLAEVPPLLI